MSFKVDHSQISRMNHQSVPAIDGAAFMKLGSSFHLTLGRQSLPISFSLQKMEGPLYPDHYDCLLLALLLTHTTQPKSSSASNHYVALRHTFVYAAPALIHSLTLHTCCFKIRYHYHALHEISRVTGFLSILSCFSATRMVVSCIDNPISHTTSHGEPEY